MDEKKDSQKTRKKRGVNASDHSGWSSENSPWGGGSSSGRGTGPEGRGDGGGHNSSSRHNLDLSKTPEAMTTMSYVAIPMTVYPVNGVLGFTINWTAIDSALVQGINYLSKALPYAGSLLGGVIAGALYPNDTIVSEKKEQEMLTNSRAFSIADKTQGYKITSLPASIVSEIPLSDITKRTEAPTKVLSELAINMNNKKHEMAITKQQKTSNIAVIKAEKTSKPNVYTAQIIPGMKPMHIRVNPDKNQVKHSAKVNSTPAINPYLSSPSTKDSYHAFVHFDGKHEPIYVSVSRIPNQKEEKKQVEEAIREWTSMHPIEAAQLEFDIANKSFIAIDKQYQTELSALNKLQATPEGLTLSNPAKYPLIYQQTPEHRKSTGKEIAVRDMSLINILLQKGIKAYVTEIVNRETNNSKIITSYAPVLIGAFSSTLGERLLDAHKKIEQQKKKLQPFIESRKKAEDKKRAAEDKLEKEKRRNQPGIVSGKGKKVGDKWLEEAEKELGAPIPSQIADKLRGKKFNSFDEFRKKFWQEVSKDPELSKQFDPGNLATMKNGRAPYVRKTQRAGKRIKVELHHIKHIKNNGAVYDVDNLGVVTPKRHLEIHSQKGDK